MKALDATQKQELRETVLDVLAVREGHAHDAGYILRRAAQDVDFSVDEDNINDALIYLRDWSFVKSEESPFGAGLTWRASAQGVLASEKKNGNRPRHD